MAKVTAGRVIKLTFGKRKSGKAKKSYGPTEQKPKRYRGQGR